MNKLDGDIAVERLNAAVGAFLDIITQPEGEMVPVPERQPQPSLAERVRMNLKPSTDAAQGFAEEAKQAAADAQAAANAVGGAIQVDTFTHSGTWRKPDNAKWIEVIAIGQGAGGASGEVTADTMIARGGPGGGGGAMQYLSLPADMVDESCAVSVPNLGGRGGAASTRASNPGEYGSPSSIRLSNYCFLLAEGAPRTDIDTFPQGGPGGGYRGNQGLFAGGRGGSGSAFQGGAGTNTVDGGPASRGGGAGGGGAGGGVPARAYTGQMGGGGGGNLMNGFFGSGGRPQADAAVAKNAVGYIGSGGHGGGGSAFGPGGAGSDGVNYGGGGGGGGAARTGEYSGAGGNGGPGIVVVITHF